jgi:hypothetical protein
MLYKSTAAAYRFYKFSLFLTIHGAFLVYSYRRGSDVAFAIVLFRKGQEDLFQRGFAHSVIVYR